jgi:uncharacterized protein
MLRIAFEEIPDGGVDVVQDLGRDWIEPLLGPQFIVGDDRLHVDFHVLRAGPSAVARGQLTGKIGFVCSRCAEEAFLPVSHSFTHLFVKGDRASAVPDEATEADDLEVTFFDGTYLDLETLAAEEFVLSLPAVPLCSDACKGICQGCGKNLNEGMCSCHADVVDPRWAKLRDLKL